MAKSLLITGAAGRIGSACAVAGLQSGYQVILSDVSKTRLNKIRDKLNPD